VLQHILDVVGNVTYCLIANLTYFLAVKGFRKSLPSGYQGVGGCHPPPSFFCIMRLIHMEYNFEFLSSCRIFVGTHFMAEVVLVSHATKKLHPK